MSWRFLFQARRASFCSRAAATAATPPAVIVNRLKECCRLGKVESAESHFAEIVSNEAVTPVVLESMIDMYCRANNVSGAEAMFQHFTPTKQPLKRTLIQYITFYCDNNDVAKAESCYKSLVARGLKPTPETFSSLIKLYTKNNDIDNAVSVSTQMEDARVKRTKAISAILLHVYTASQNVSKAEEIFNSKDFQSDVSSYVSMMKMYLKVGDHRKIESMFRFMNEQGLEPTLSVYMLLTQSLEAQERFDEAYNVLMCLRQSGIALTADIYTAVISCLAKADFDRALEVLVEMARDKLKPDLATFNALITSNKEVNRVSALLDRMKAADIAPDGTSYNASIQLCVEMKEFWYTLPLLDQMSLLDLAVAPATCLSLGELFSLHPAFVRRAIRNLQRFSKQRGLSKSATYSSLIIGLANGGHLQLAEKILRSAKEVRLQMNMEAYITLIACYARDNQSNSAIGLFNELSGTQVPKEVLTDMLLSLFSCCEQNNHHAELVSVVEALKKAEVPLDAATYISVINCCARNDSVSAMLKYYFEMKNANVAPSKEVYSAVITCCSRTSQLAPALRAYDEMRKADLEPTKVIFNTVIEVLDKMSNLEKLTEVFRDMKQSNNDVGVDTYELVISSCANRRSLQRAIACFEEMKQASLEPTPAIYDSLISLACNVRRRDIAEAFMNELLMTDLGNFPRDRLAALFHRLLQMCLARGQLQEALNLESRLNTYNIVPDPSMRRTLRELHSAITQTPRRHFSSKKPV